MHVGRRFVPVAIVLAIIVMAARSSSWNDKRNIRARIEALAESATVYMTISVSGDKTEISRPEPRQVAVTLTKVRGEWLVSRGEVLRTLDPRQ